MLLRPVCRLHTRQAGRFYALCELIVEELSRSAAPLLFFSATLCGSYGESAGRVGPAHYVADCGGNSRKGLVVGTFGKVAYTEHGR